MTLCKQYLITCFTLLVFYSCHAQPLHQNRKFTRQDSLRGTITPERAWWDVNHYNITVSPDFSSKTITGSVKMLFKVIAEAQIMQVDLQQPMQLDQVRWKNQELAFKRDGNIFLLTFPSPLKAGAVEEIVFSFSGKPREAVHPPWDGGWIWKKDDRGNPWITVACQGLGASSWFPCKDHQSDEPDSAVLSVICPDNLVGVANGRLRHKQVLPGKKLMYTWAVVNPINNYNIIPYIGNYVNIADSFAGLQGKLDINYWVLNDNREIALKHMVKDVHDMLSCFEDWFGPYPFYEDGYKLVEAPHLGMEHQSAIAYGNGFKKGYAGRDLSASGWGLKWDFIIIHESGHEWFGNNITTKDVADMWVHESFTNYAETLFTETLYGKEAGNEYVIGTRKLIQNDIPIVGVYGVNQEGSSDMYYKGGNMIHTIRQVINDDVKFKNILRGLNKTFYHQIVTGAEIEKYISSQSGIDFSTVFDQYLRNTGIPMLEYKIKNKKLSFRWSHCVKGFNMPVKVMAGKETWLYPTEKWKEILMPAKSKLEVDRNFYIDVKK